MAKNQKILLSTLVVGLLCGLTSLGVFGLFSATTQNAGNEISTGTVAISDNDAGSALYNITGAKPGDTVSRCIRTTYTGSLPASVRLYTTSAPGDLAQYVDLTITKGTQAGSTFPDCTGFAADTGGVLFTGTLQGFEQARNSFANGIATAPAGLTVWSTGSSVVYKVDATLQAGTPDSGQGSTSGAHTFIWEARNT
ncbi:MAG: hypothetical protein QOI73_2106 [Solirubrobacteraceae bacterium]|jgi:hypothetical protein|nr:hypothetical protein [Solirubrobacteraceae bacterium]